MSNQRGTHIKRNRSKSGKKNFHNKDQDFYGAGYNSERSQNSRNTIDNDADKSASNPDIPGFYFDKEKKKYFRILPGQNNPCDSSFVTRESVQKKQREDTRQRDLKLLSCTAVCKTRLKLNAASTSKLPACSGLTSVKKKLWRSTNVGDIINSTPLGITSTFQFKYRMRHIIAANLKPFAHSKVFDSPTNTYERLEHMQYMFPSTVNSNNLICLWSLKQVLVQRIQQLTVKSVQQTGENSSKLNVTVTGAMIPKAVSKITSMCCAPMCLKDSTEEYVLYTTMCLIGNNPSLIMLRNLNCTDSSDFRFSEFSISCKATWCSAWNCDKKCFSIGTERCGFLIDVETRSMWKLHSQNSDVLSQDFTQSGNILYSGTRRGVIIGHDLRTKSAHHTMTLNHKTGVCSLKALCHQDYLLASDFNDQIRKWDLRQQKVVTEYRGHRNQHSIIPLHVGEELDIVYSAGQDCYSRIWSLQSGEQIKAIPPPRPASITTIPTLHYSDCIGGRPGLLMGMLDELHYYSM